MKDSLFDLLLDLFEKTITQLKERYPLAQTGSEGVAGDDDVDESIQDPVASPLSKKTTLHMALIKPASANAVRVLTPLERNRLTKASYQLLERLSVWNIIPADAMELILNRLMFSESRFVQLQETKWTIRATMAATLDAEQLAFLDLVLYQKENGLALN